MARSLVVITPPAQEPLSLADAKAHLRVDVADWDATITAFVVAARTRVEQASYTRLMTQTLELGLDAFPGGWWGPQTRQPFWPPPNVGMFPVIELEPPLQSVTSIKYLDPNGVQQTWDPANYVVDTATRPGRVMPAIGQAWPVSAFTLGGVKIRFVAGYASASAIPGDLMQCVKLLLGLFFENREQAQMGERLTVADLPHGITELLTPYQPAMVG